jgi:cytochrome c biogenesis protein CcmG/thiol:disulfide interchange protein DsbE
MRWRRWLLWGTVTAAAVVLLVVFGLRGGHSVTGRTAPSLPQERLTGSSVTLAGLLAAAHGKPAVVVFWASWCDPCKQEAPALQRFSQRVPGRLVAVDTGDVAAEARAFIHRYGWTFPDLRDGEGTTGNRYRIATLPTTFVIDGSGHIRAVLHGPQTEASLSRAVTAVERS